MVKFTSRAEIDDFLHPARGSKVAREYPTMHDKPHVSIEYVAAVDLLQEYPRVTAAMVAQHAICSREEALASLRQCVAEGFAIQLPGERFTQTDELKR